jgi:hypothetical protein
LATKVAILRDLSNRSGVVKHDVQAVVDSPGFPYIGEMLGSPDPAARFSSCRLLYRLAVYEYTIPHILEMRGCERLAALLK